MNPSRKAFLLLSTFAWPAAGAYAQAAPPATSRADASRAAAPASVAQETVTVIAQRRRQDPQKVPVSLTVIDASRLRHDAQLRRTSDVARLVPNLQGAATEGPERPRWFMRGIGTNSTIANTVNPVGIYYDEVYIANVYNQGWPLFDLAQVEVLQGPQGTLWGKNANGGAIDFISQAPSFHRSGYVMAGGGSFDHTQEQAAIGGTIVPDRIAGRFAFYADDRDGWQKNVHDGRHLGGGLDTAARGQLLFTPSHDLDVLLNTHFRRYDGTVLPQQYLADRSGIGGGFGNASTVYIPGYNQADAIPRLKYDQTDTRPATEFVQEIGGSAKVTWRPGDITITSITAVEHNDRVQTEAYPMPAPASGTTPYNAALQTGRSWQATEELHVASPQHQRLSWMLGLFGLYEQLHSVNAAAYYLQPVTASGSSVAYSVPPYGNYTYNQNWASGSAFANAGYDLTRRLKITGGIRWSLEAVGITNDYYATPLSGVTLDPSTDIGAVPAAARHVYGQKQHNTFRNVNADVTLQYELAANALAYFRFASGKMPGNYAFTGYSRVPGTAISAVQLTQVDPETINAYELGLKTQWFRKRLTLNADIFRYDYDNALVNVPTNIGSGITTIVFRNAGAALIEGAEIGLDAHPIEPLRLGANLGLLSTRYTSEDSASDGILGAQIPRAPKVSLSGFVNYSVPLPRGEVVLGGDVQFYSKQFFYPSVVSQTTDPLLQQGAYSLINAHLTWYPADSHKLSFDASVLNLAGTRYRTLAITPINGLSSVTLGEPRSFFLQAQYRF